MTVGAGLVENPGSLGCRDACPLGSDRSYRRSRARRVSGRPVCLWAFCPLKVTRLRPRFLPVGHTGRRVGHAPEGRLFEDPEYPSTALRTLSDVRSRNGSLGKPAHLVIPSGREGSYVLLVTLFLRGYFFLLLSTFDLRPLTFDRISKTLYKREQHENKNSPLALYHSF